MDKNWIHIMVILVFYSKITSGAVLEKQLKDGEKAEMKCKPADQGTMVIWFRMLDNSGIEFIGSFSNNGMIKFASPSLESIFSFTKMNSNILVLSSFDKTRDTGSYTCSSLVSGRELKFGEITRLVPEKVEVQQTTRAPTEQKPCSTVPPNPCACDKGDQTGQKGVIVNTHEGKTESSMFCTPIILGPLVGGCGLLLLLLIITTVYCNQVRTRRCPHHYKRKPRTTPSGKQMQPGRHV